MGYVAEILRPLKMSYVADILRRLKMSYVAEILRRFKMSCCRNSASFKDELCLQKFCVVSR